MRVRVGDLVGRDGEIAVFILIVRDLIPVLKPGAADLGIVVGEGKGRV